MRLVLDTCVLVAAIRSQSGSSDLLVKAALRRRSVPLVSVPLVLEYEAVLARPEHLGVSGFSVDEVVGLVKAFCLAGEPVHLPCSIGPLLNDPGDEFVIQTAIFGEADAIVTFNRRHFESAARKFHIEVVSPSEALKRIGPL